MRCSRRRIRVRVVPTDGFVERRKAARYTIDLPIELTCNGVRHLARTHDVSPCGVSVIVAGPAAIGVSDVLTFSLVMRHIHPETASRLEGSGTVVRTDCRAGDLLIAFKAHYLSTLPLEGVFGDSLLLLDR